MDPYVEQRLRDEVIYLHSLWRRGPPGTVPAPQFVPPTTTLIASGPEQPNTSGTGKKQKRKNKKKKIKMTQMDEENQNEEKRQKVSDLAWTCMEPPRVEPSESGNEWPAFKTKSDQALELTLEERAVMNARRVQQRGIDACRKFFKEAGSNSELESEGESESESESESENESDDESQEFTKLFTGLFEDDKELREFYLNNWSNGEFCCLVCRGNGEKVTKKFRNCVAIVQHSVTISSTHKRRAHRTYGQIICNLLNWDINKLPAEALPVGDQGGLKLGESEASDGMMTRDPGAITAGAWDVKWPVDKKPTSMSGWGQVLSEPNVDSQRELTEDEKIKVAAAKLQERPREAARAFFSRDEYMNSDDESDDENSMDGSEIDECEEYKFLTTLFEDCKLREYYKRSWGSGAFSCLVCWGSLEKLNKRYKDCVALVQHCVSVSKTKRKIAHRAYGKIICEILSWDINKLPVSGLPASDVIGANSGDPLVKVSSLEIRAAEMVSEQREEPIKISSDNMSLQSEEPKLDSSWEKGYEKPEEPKADSIVNQQLDGSANTVSTCELGWAPFNPNTSQSLTKELTVAEQMKSNSIKVHQKCLDATRAFLTRDRSSDSDDDSQEDEEEEEEEEEESEKDDLNTFFTSLLGEGGELIEYCQKNWENGDFSCLVCGASGENLTKKFKNLVAVVQHSVTVAKSKRIRAHRVYGQVLCKALNWDIKRLPVISFPVEDHLCPTFAKSQVDERANSENKDAIHMASSDIH